MRIPVASIVTPDDIAEARLVGLARDAQAYELNRSQPYGAVDDRARRIYIDCYAALAECAVARWLDLPWTKLVDDLSVKPPDVGTNIEVRWSPRPYGHLIGHPEDADGWFMVSVRGELPSMEIIGWTTTTALKQECYRNNPKARNPPGEFWMPIGHLMIPEMLSQMRWQR